LKTKQCDWCSRLNTGKYFNKSISLPESFLCEQCHVFECANQSLPELDSEEKIDSNSRQSQALKKIITLDDLLQGKWNDSMCQHFEVYDNILNFKWNPEKLIKIQETDDQCIILGYALKKKSTYSTTLTWKKENEKDMFWYQKGKGNYTNEPAKQNEKEQDVIIPFSQLLMMKKKEKKRNYTTKQDENEQDGSGKIKC
jgi:hypothetical protein